MKRISSLLKFFFFIPALLLVAGCSNFEQKTDVTDLSVPLSFNISVNEISSAESKYYAVGRIIFVDRNEIIEEGKLDESLSYFENDLLLESPVVPVEPDKDGNCYGTLNFKDVPVGRKVIIEINIFCNDELYAFGISEPHVVIAGVQTLKVKMNKTHLEPIDPVDPVEPEDPVDPVEPTDPVDPENPEEGEIIVGINGNMDLVLYTGVNGLKAKVSRKKLQSNGYYETNISYTDEDNNYVNYFLSGAPYSNPDLNDDIYFPYVIPGKEYKLEVSFVSGNGNSEMLKETFAVTIPETAKALGEAYVKPVAGANISDVFAIKNNALLTASDNLEISENLIGKNNFFLKASFYRAITDYGSWLGDIIVSQNNWNKARSLYSYDNYYEKDLLGGGNFDVSFSVILNYSDGEKDYSIICGSFFDSIQAEIIPITRAVTSLASNDLSLPAKTLYAFERADRNIENYFSLESGKAAGHGIEYKFMASNAEVVLTELFVDPSDTEGLELMELDEDQKKDIADYMNLDGIENIYKRSILTKNEISFNNTEDGIGVYYVAGEMKYIYHKSGWRFSEDGIPSPDLDSINIFLLEDFDF